MTDAAPASPWGRWSWVFAGIWLVFLVYPVIETLQSDHSVAVTALGLGLIAAFGVVYMLGYGALADRPWLVSGLLVALALATVPIIGIEAIALTPYLGVYSALQVPAPWWPWTTTVVALLPLLSLVAGDGFPAFFFLMVWPIIVGMVLMRLFTDGQRRVDASRAELALVAERERVARDVHDVLGHSLTALSIKAELAGRLIDVDPERAKAELVSIQETARQALAEVRDAGIQTRVLGSVADTDPRHRTLLAWVLREAVTNVVRHAGAGAVVIEIGPRGISVTDDGAGISEREGNGLRGMRERVSDAGGTLSVAQAGPGTRVQVVMS